MRGYFTKTILVLAVLVIGVLLLVGCAKKGVTYPSETKNVLGTKVTVTIYDTQVNKAELPSIFADAFKLISDLEKITLSNGPGNQVTAISGGSGEQSIQMDAQVFDMIMKALKLYDNGGKAFDIRYGPMIDAWGFDTKPRVPRKSELDSLQSLVTDGGMFVAGTSILLAKQGMRFDVRGIAEGYIFDQVAAKLYDRGIRSASIHSARTWRTMGDPPDKRGFEIQLGNPLKPDSVWATAYVPVGGVSLVSVGQNRFESGGKAYHSILDPRTGMPAEKCYAVILQATDAALAQGLAYSVFVNGSTESLAALGKNSVIGSVIVTGSGASPQAAKQGSLKDLELHR